MDGFSAYYGRISRDLVAGAVVFLIALPLSLGIALASNAPPLAGIVAAILGGVLVGAISGSHTSVSGPAAGLTAVAADQIAELGSFEAFLMAVLVAGIFQIGLGVLQAGFIAAFFPASVIKGLLAAIGVILILKQIPHLLGHDSDPEGEMAFVQPDHENTFSEFVRLFGDMHLGAAVVGLTCLAILFAWDRIYRLKHSGVPAPLVVVLLGVGMNWIFARWGEPWQIMSSHLVGVPVADGLRGFFGQLDRPDFSQWNQSGIYVSGLTIAAVASLETLLNLEAIDKLDPRQRVSPPNQELIAQGVGNLASGILGGLPVTSVIVRGTVNISSGALTKLSAVTHGILMAGFVMLIPGVLNRIPLASLAAILLHTGIKLASPKLVHQLWSAGRYQFLPFIVTVTAIVFTDLLVGVLIGLGVSLGFILYSSFKRPLRQQIERHLGGDVLHIQLANQVSFLNRGALTKALNEVPAGGHVLLDAESTDYIDPDVLDLLKDYALHTAPARRVTVSQRGFAERYNFPDQIHFIDYSTLELQRRLTPDEVLEILQQGHRRFRSGQRLTRNLGRLVSLTAGGQHPLAAVLSCIDSRTPAEVIFDLAVGDAFSVRVAGNVISPRVLGSLEYAAAIAGARLIIVLGHTRCGAVTAAVEHAVSNRSVLELTGCDHLAPILQDIQTSMTADLRAALHDHSEHDREAVINLVALNNVSHSIQEILRQSRVIRQLVATGKVGIAGGLYDVVTGDIVFHDRPDLYRGFAAEV